jgi:hypothetical protein
MQAEVPGASKKCLMPTAGPAAAEAAAAPMVAATQGTKARPSATQQAAQPSSDPAALRHLNSEAAANTPVPSTCSPTTNVTAADTDQGTTACKLQQQVQHLLAASLQRLLSAQAAAAAAAKADQLAAACAKFPAAAAQMDRHRMRELLQLVGIKLYPEAAGQGSDAAQEQLVEHGGGMQKTFSAALQVLFACYVSCHRWCTYSNAGICLEMKGFCFLPSMIMIRALFRSLNQCHFICSQHFVCCCRSLDPACSYRQQARSWRMLAKVGLLKR